MSVFWGATATARATVRAVVHEAVDQIPIHDHLVPNGIHDHLVPDGFSLDVGAGGVQDHTTSF